MVIAERFAPVFRPVAPADDLIERYHDLVGHRAALVRLGLAVCVATFLPYTQFRSANIIVGGRGVLTASHLDGLQITSTAGDAFDGAGVVSVIGRYA